MPNRPAFCLLPLSLAAAASAQGPADLPPFTAVTLQGGGEIVVRHGPEQRVALTEGSDRYSRLEVRDGRLVANRCAGACPKGYRMKVEIVTPRITGLSVEDGGIVRTEGAFPDEDAVAASVAQGGAVDMRSMRPAHVAAAVTQGGRIFAIPSRSLTASVRQGGGITYWGDPTVQRAVRGGGVVEKGRPGDETRTLAAFNPAPPPVPPVPPLAPASPSKPRRH